MLPTDSLASSAFPGPATAAARIDGVPLDQFYDFKVASHRWPGATRPPHVSKIYRAALRGEHGVKLRALKGPGRLLTCDQWIAEYLVAVDAAKSGVTPHVSRGPRRARRSPSQRPGSHST